MNKAKKKKLVKAAVGTAAVAGAAVLALGNLAYDQTFTAKAMKKRSHPFTLEPEEKEKYLKNPALIRDDKTWYACMEPEEQVVVSARGDALHAEYLNPQTGSHIWCLCLHGWTSCPQNVGIPARHFYEKGWNVLLPHMRAHGKSEHKNVTMGWLDRLDILDWISYIISLDPAAEIFLIGVSMGAATVLMTTGEKMPPNVKCAVSDCAFTSVWDEVCSNAESMFHLPKHPFADAERLVTRIRAGYDIKKASCIEQVKKSVTPTLFIHGEEDAFVPYSMLQKLYDAAACEKDILSVPDAYHANSWDVHPELYWPRTDEFISKYIKTDPTDA